MIKSRTIAVAGTIAALSLAAAPVAVASTDAHSGNSSRDRVQHVEKKSPDKKSTREAKNTRDAKNLR